MPRFVGNSALIGKSQLNRLSIKNKKVPIWREPKQIEREYIVYLTGIVQDWGLKILDLIIPFIEPLVTEASGQRPPEAIDVKSDVRLDDWNERLQELMNAFRISLIDLHPDLETNINLFAVDINNKNTKEWFKITNVVLGTPLFQMEPWLTETIKGFVNENVSLISKLKQDMTHEINETINRGIKQGLRVETIKKQIIGTGIRPLKILPKDREADILRKTRKRAQLIARDQVGKLNGQLTQLRQTGVDISQYIWRDLNDERVRKNHAAMDGLLCKWDNSTVYKNSNEDKKWFRRSSIGGVELHPGQDYQCRCYAESDFSTLNISGF